MNTILSAQNKMIAPICNPKKRLPLRVVFESIDDSVLPIPNSSETRFIKHFSRTYIVHMYYHLSIYF